MQILAFSDTANTGRHVHGILATGTDTSLDSDTCCAIFFCPLNFSSCMQKTDIWLVHLYAPLSKPDEKPRGQKILQGVPQHLHYTADTVK